MMRPPLQLIAGSGNIIATLDEVTARARAGEIEGLVIGFCTTDRHQFVGHAYRDDMAFAWVRLLAAAHDVLDHLKDGLPE